MYTCLGMFPKNKIAGIFRRYFVRDAELFGEMSAYHK